MQNNFEIKITPKEIFCEYDAGNDYKSSIGDLGIFEQSKMNERFFVGDQWHGAQCGNKRPLVRRNIIKRIGEYKMSVIGAAPISVNYSVEGVPDTAEIKKQGNVLKRNMIKGEFNSEKFADNAEISVITEALSDYQRVCAERLKFNIKNEQLLRNAYITGTGIAYTYWDDTVNTGLYADYEKTQKIKGDIAFEIIDVENVIFGDPNNDDVQTQPYILISQRLDVEQVRREAKRNGLPVDGIIPDGQATYNSGDRGETEPIGGRRVTVITKLFKQWDKTGENYTVMAVKVTENATVKKLSDIGLTMYPIAVFNWERRRCCAYGDSEITYLIPNQIAINRMSTAECYSALTVGMPKLLVNNELISPETKISNDPGQIIRLEPTLEDIGNAMRYVSPPVWATQHRVALNDLAANTLYDAGATDAALGNVNPNNASAIIQMREAAMRPMQIYQNRYYAFIEEVSRIWADFWLNKYGIRLLKIKTKDGTEYIPFDGSRYRELVLTARVDVGSSTLWSEAVQISTLDGLLKSGLITPVQYLERMPKGIIPKLTELVEDLSSQTNGKDEEAVDENEVLTQFSKQYPKEYSYFLNLPKEMQSQMIKGVLGGK